MLDCIIIGSGVAGISAALTLKANAKNFIILGNLGLSDKISKAELIRNYPGLSNVSGKAFCEALTQQLAESEIAIKEERAMGMYALKGINMQKEFSKMHEFCILPLSLLIE